MSCCNKQNRLFKKRLNKIASDFGLCKSCKHWKDNRCPLLERGETSTQLTPEGIFICEQYNKINYD